MIADVQTSVTIIFALVFERIESGGVKAYMTTNSDTDQARAKAQADAEARKAQLEIEPRITRNDIKTTGERIPYFGHMRKRK